MPYPPSNSPLERLPQELLSQVTSFLPLEYAAVLCLSSKTLYRRLPHACFDLLFLTADDMFQHMLQYANSRGAHANTNPSEQANLEHSSVFSTALQRARFLRALEKDCPTLVYCDLCLQLHRPVTHEDSSDAENDGETTAVAKTLTDKFVCFSRLGFPTTAPGRWGPELWDLTPADVRQELHLYEGYFNFRKGIIEVLPARFHFLQIKMLMKQYRLGLDFSKIKAFLECSPLSIDIAGGWTYTETNSLHPTPKGLFLNSKHEYSLPWSTKTPAAPWKPEPEPPFRSSDSFLGYRQMCAHCTLRRTDETRQLFDRFRQSFSQRRWFWWLRSKLDFIFRRVISCPDCPTEIEVRVLKRREKKDGAAKGEKVLVYSITRWMDLGMGELATDGAWKSHFVDGSFPGYKCGSVKAMDTTFLAVEPAALL